MTRFYDPASIEELESVEKILRSSGIEYALAEDPRGGQGWMQIEVAEEDLPRAEEVLARASRG